MIKVPRRQLVQATAAKLRELILSREPGAQIGSLNEVAQLLDVGIVTVQQAARILEHEGLLAVRRGPGGGYYGTRPDEAALERSIAAYLRVHGFGHRESQQMLSLLDCEIVPGGGTLHGHRAAGNSPGASRIGSISATRAKNGLPSRRSCATCC